MPRNESGQFDCILLEFIAVLLNNAVCSCMLNFASKNYLIYKKLIVLTFLSPLLLNWCYCWCLSPTCNRVMLYFSMHPDKYAYWYAFDSDLYDLRTI